MSADARRKRSYNSAFQARRTDRMRSEGLCALNPRLADGEVHHTAMAAIAAIREEPK